MTHNNETEANIGERINRIRLASWITWTIVLILIISFFTIRFFQNNPSFNEPLLAKELDNNPAELQFKDDFSGYGEYSEVLDQPVEDLSRWQDGGTITAWVNVDDWRSVDRLDFKLTDSSGRAGQSDWSS